MMKAVRTQMEGYPVGTGSDKGNRIKDEESGMKLKQVSEGSELRGRSDTKGTLNGKAQEIITA